MARPRPLAERVLPGPLRLAEDAAREQSNLSLAHALQLVHLYADRGSPSFERAALRWLGRYLDEGSPTLAQFADVTATLAAKDPTAP